jgi:hypothetical protein
MGVEAVDFETLDGRPTLFFVAVVSVFPDFVRGAAGRRVVDFVAVLVVVGAFFAASNAFCFSRASCSSLEGSFNLIRFRPLVSSSISFSFSAGTVGLLE